MLVAEPYSDDPRTTGSHLLSETPQMAYQLWEPKSVCVVLGQSNVAAEELQLDLIREDDVPIIRRRSGGGAVVLAPGMLVSAVMVPRVSLGQTRHYFDLFTHLFVNALAGMGVREVHRRGTSDICVGMRKILGSSVYRNATQLLYHHVLLVDAELSLIPRYLRHPSREPCYRKGRGHEDFVTSLSQSGYTFSVGAVKRVFMNLLEKQKDVLWNLSTRLQA